jgi:hypothetical protein
LHRHLASREEYHKAYEVMQDMRRALPQVKLTLYISPKTIEVGYRGGEIARDFKR